MSAPSLYRLTQDVEALADLMADVIDSGADDVAVDAIVESWLTELGDTLERRLDLVAQWRANQCALVVAAKTEATRLTALAKTREGHVDRVDGVVLALLQRLGTKRVDTPTAVFSVRKAGGKPAVVVADTVDVSSLPPGTFRVTYAPIKDELRARLESGEKIDGVTIREPGFTLSVK